MISIGNLTLASRCLLAPLAGISDLPFRMINRSFGCSFAFTAMISARSLAYQNRNTMEMLTSIAEDRPLGVQLVGDDADSLKKAIYLLGDYKYDLLDFNSACPVQKVTGKGAGAGLLKEPRKLHSLLKVIVRHSPVPVTVKIRAGWDDNSLNAREIGLYAQDAGVQGIFIHGRTKEQGYRGRVNYQIIREVKDALEIPVIGSGDALSPQLIKVMFDETGCDGVVIARGSLGNPWIFRETEDFLRDGSLISRPEIGNITDTMTIHFRHCLDFYGEANGTMIFRKFFGWYTKSLRGAKLLRDRAFRAKTAEQMLNMIQALSASQQEAL